MINKNFSKEFVKYFLAAGIAFVFDFSTLYFFTEFFKMHYLVSAAWGFVVGVVTVYFLSVGWVFTNRIVKNKHIEFAVFVVIGIVGLGLNELAMWFFTEKLLFHYLQSKVISTGLVLFWNFSARKRMLFR